MIERHAFCDVCRQPIDRDMTTLAVVSGPLTLTLPSEVHLCQADAERFLSPLRAGRAELAEDLPRDPTPT